MTVHEVMAELQALGSDQTKRTLLRHGSVEPLFGVKIEDMKRLLKRIKADHELALDLWETGNGDARYLAGLACVPARLTREVLRRWAESAQGPMLSDYAVAWCAAESPHGFELAREWIDSLRLDTACAGWSTWSSLVGLTPDEDLDLDELRGLLARVEERLHQSPERLRRTMHGFLIAAGGGVAVLTTEALAVASRLDTRRTETPTAACRLPDVAEYLERMRQRGVIGKKRRQARC